MATRLRRCLEFVWDAAAGRVPTTVDVDACQHELEHLAPEIDSGVLAYAAMECAASAWDGLETVRRGSASQAIRPATAFGEVIEVYLMRRNHSRSDSYEVEADRQGDTDHVLWRPHAEALAGVLSALAGSSSLDDRRLESIRERSIDPSVEVLVDLLEAASRASSE